MESSMFLVVLMAVAFAFVLLGVFLDEKDN